MKKNQLEKPECGIASIQQDQILFVQMLEMRGRQFPFPAAFGRDKGMMRYFVERIE